MSEKAPMLLTHKPPEELQAQAAAFAAERLPHHEDARFFLQNLGEIAVGEAQDVSRITERKEFIRNEQGRATKVEAGAERQVATVEEYTDFLRAVGGSEYGPIAGRTELLHAFKDFEPLVKSLKESLKDYENSKDHPNYLGSGANADVFVITLDGQDYVVRLTHSEDVSAADVDRRARSGMLAKGIPHLEQVVASSYEEGATISERMPGQEMGRIKAEEIQHITDEQLNGFVDTLFAANQAGINIDTKPSNFLYDREQGFGIIDLGTRDSRTAREQSVADIAVWFEAVIAHAGTYGAHPNTPEDYSYMREQKNAQLPLLTRYRAVCEQRFAGEELAKITQRIDARIAGLTSEIEHYGDPEWVARKIEEERKRKVRAA